jgi:hypothetical protein
MQLIECGPAQVESDFSLIADAYLIAGPGYEYIAGDDDGSRRIPAYCHRLLAVDVSDLTGQQRLSQVAAIGFGSFICKQSLQ